MKTVAIVGGSGVVGARVLDLLLAREDVGRVVALGRRTLPVVHAHLDSRVVDLGDVAALVAALPDGLDVAICCLGTTMKQAGSKEAFRAVDLEAVLAFGRAARRRGARRFLVVTAVGSSASSGNFYLRTKGEAEQGLAKLGFDELVVLRPSFLDDQGARSDHRLGERLALPLARGVFAVLGRTRRYAPIPAVTVARALLRLAFEEARGPVRAVESESLHALGA